MAKDKITDYDATAANNTDVGGVNIQGTAAISNADNAFREIMSHLKETSAGTYPVEDTWTFGDPADLTKRVRMDAGNVSAGQTRVLSMPDANVSLTGGTSVSETATQTLQNKTLEAPVFSTSLSVTGDITPAQITADQNDYNPTGLSTASTLRLSSDTFRTITGLQGGADGRLLLITNVSSQIIAFNHEDTNSTAANRFVLPSSKTIHLDTNCGMLLRYDATQSRWVVLSVSRTLADQTAMEAAASYYNFVTPQLQHHHPSAAKCWGEFLANSTTILASYNITSIANTATGSMQVTIANDFSSANWACMVSGAEDDLTLVYSTTYDQKTAGVVQLKRVVEAGSGTNPSSGSGNASWSMVGYGDL